MNLQLININIRFDNPEDPWPWHERLKVLSNRIHQMSPHIIATQEGRKPQLLQLAEELKPKYTLVDHHRSWHDTKMFPCLFFNQDYLELVQSYDRWLSKTPEIPHSKDFGSYWPKLAVLASFKHRQTDTPLNVASFHLDNASAEARPMQANVLIEQVKSCLPRGELFLLGDANDLDSSPTIDVFRKHSFNEPWQYKNAPSTFHGFDSSKPGGRIDYIFYQTHQASLTKFNTDDATPPYYSDHVIVEATFNLKKSR